MFRFLNLDRSPIQLLCACVLFVSLFGATASADDWVPGDPWFPPPSEMSDEPVWIPITDYGREHPGVAPVIAVDFVADGALEKLKVSAKIHGFWAEPFRHHDPNADRRFLLFRVPGMGTKLEVGFPQLPVLRMQLGLTSRTAAIDFGAADRSDVMVFAEALIAPCQPPFAEQARGENENEPFKMDGAFYGAGQGAWPASGGHARACADVAKVPCAQASMNPFQYDPATRKLYVSRTMTCEVSYPRAKYEPIHMSRTWADASNQILRNHQMLLEAGLIQTQPLNWRGRYLIIYPYGWITPLAPLVTLKQERGYFVDLLTIDEIGSNDSEDIFAAIKAWYDSHSSLEEKYVLLVGDSGLIPHRVTVGWTGGTSDMRYAFLHSDQSPSLWLGRLPAHSFAECGVMVDKIVRHQTSSSFDFDYYETATLAAHPGEADSYLNCIRQIIAQGPGYDVSRTFIDRGGDTPDGRDEHVITDVNDTHVGIVMYRGHGDTDEWWDWDFDGDVLDVQDLNQLTSDFFNPIFLNIDCLNHAIDIDQNALGRELMTMPKAAVASVGAMEVSYRRANNTFAELLWLYIQDDSPNSLAVNTMCALNSAAIAWDSNGASQWNQQVYSVFGDPEMTVFNRSPLVLEIDFVADFALHYGTPSDVHVNGGGVLPMQDIVVTLSGQNGPLFTGVTDSAGKVTIPALDDLGIDETDLAEGQLRVRAWSDNQNASDFAESVDVESDDDVVGDINGDGIVDGADLTILLGAWGSTNAAADLNGDGAVDGADLTILLGAWTG